MELSDGLKEAIADAADKLKGTERRTFVARVAQAFGWGGQRRAAEEFGWGRNTIRKGRQELITGFGCVDGFNLRGALPIEERLPHLQEDIVAIVEGMSQTDPTFKTTRIYRRITAGEVRQQLHEKKGYGHDNLPSERTIRRRLNTLGYRPAKVRKSKAKKKSPKRMPFLQT